MNSADPHIVILGGGFAGLSAAKALRNAPVRITLVDRQNHHLFQPLLYQVATAGLSAPDIAQPLRHILADQKNCTTLMDEVTGIDTENNRVHLKDSTLFYDYLIVGLGAKTGYFGNDQWEKHAPGLKSLDEAKALRRKLLMAFEKAETCDNPAEWEKLLTFVVVGGGPTGVEMAGAMAELSRRVLAKDFRRIDPTRAHIHLVEAGPRLLPMFAESQSEYTKQRLENMGVTIHLNAPVSQMEDGRVHMGEHTIEAGTTIWAAGVEGNPVIRTLKEAPLARGNRVDVAPDLSLPGRPNVFIAGDLASLTDAKGKKVPGVAPAAMQMGKHAAKQILRDLKGKSRKDFVYLDKGNMATIGRSSAVAEFAGMRTNGAFAWLMWLGVHLVFLLGLRNRIMVFLHWVWSYLTWQRGARIITGQDHPEETGKNRQEQTAA